MVKWTMVGELNEMRGQRGATAESAPQIVDSGLKFVTPQLLKLSDVWQARRAGRTMPARADFGMRELAFVLPHLGFLAIVPQDGRARFLVRLQGSELDAYAGPMTGHFIDEVVPKKFTDKWQASWLQAIELKQPLRVVARVEYRDRHYYVSESLCAPLAADGETPDGVMVGVYYHVSDGTPSNSWVAAQLARELDVRA